MLLCVSDLSKINEPNAPNGEISEKYEISVSNSLKSTVSVRL